MSVKLTDITLRTGNFDKSIPACRRSLMEKDCKTLAGSGTGNNKTKKYKGSKSKKKRKIKIRLKDPNDPESYICEIYDSSFEKEDETIKTSEKKPKNFFEVLMGKESRPIMTVSTTAANNLSLDETSFKKSGVNKCDKASLKKVQNENNLKRKIVEKTIDKVSTNGDISSDDENLFEIQTKIKKVKKSRKDAVEFFSKVFAPVREKSPETKSDSSKSTRLSSSNAKTKWRMRLKPKSDDVIDLSSNSDTESEQALVSTKKLAPIFMRNTDQIKTKKNVGVDSPKSDVKLAPLFIKKMKVKNTLNESQLNFLHSGIPKNLQIMKRKEVFEEDYYYYPFVQHVRQTTVNWEKVVIDNNPCGNKVTVNKLFKYQITESCDNSSQNFIKNLGLIKNCETSYPNLNVKKMFECCKMKFDASLKRKRKRRKKDEAIKFENPVWLDKYKPLCSQDILGNIKSVNKLKEWLETWKSYDEEVKVMNQNSNKKMNGSDDEFMSTDEDGFKNPVNTCIIQGELGCGKTSLVYCLANELRYNVLEINSSSRRNGKKILADLQEATQSHKVHHDQLTKFLNPNSQDVLAESKISLILIEDADIVFDEDEGFISALSTLSQSSKRPVIIVSNDPSCSHLEKFKNSHNLVIHMSRPTYEQTSCYLEILATVEGVECRNNSIKNIVYKNGGDLRKCLQDLQFNVLSAKSPCQNNKLPLQFELPISYNLTQVWWNCNKFIFQQNIIHKPLVIPSLKKRRLSLDDSLYDCGLSDEECESVTNNINEETHVNVKFEDTPPCSQPISMDVTTLLDCLSFVDTLTREKCGFLKDSSSLDENFDYVSLTDLQDDISRYLLENNLAKYSTISKYDDSKLFDVNLPDINEIRWCEQHNRARQQLSQVVSENYRQDFRKINLDYLPQLRTICRSELGRSLNNTKRKNRFYHYIKSLGTNPSESTLELSCSVFNSENSR